MNSEELASQMGSGRPDINAIRQGVVTKEFENNPGARALLMIGQFPFLIIGKIEDVVSDYLLIKAEITNIFDFDGKVFRVHIDDIEVFYIENEGIPIPDIRQGGES